MAKITIFGLAGTGKSSAGRGIAEKLTYEYISSGNMLRAKAKEMNLSITDFRELCKSDSTYDKALDQEIKAIGETRNNIVVESRLAWHFIPDSVKVKLSCEYEERIRRVASRDQMSIEETKRLVKNREEADAYCYKSFYNIDNMNDDSNFDLVVDTTSVLVADVVRRIIDHVESIK